MQNVQKEIPNLSESPNLPRESCWRIKVQQSIAATILLCSYYKTFREEAARQRMNMKIELSDKFTKTKNTD